MNHTQATASTHSQTDSKTDQKITVAVVLPMRDKAGAEEFVAHVSKPGDRSIANI